MGKWSLYECYPFPLVLTELFTFWDCDDAFSCVMCVSATYYNPSFTVCRAEQKSVDLERYKRTDRLKGKKKTANIYHTDLSLSLCVCLLSCSKYRPQSSEPQTDGLSVSTTADGSQPNVRKLCDTPPPAPQAHTHNLAYYDNIICQVRPTLSFFSPPIQQSFILYLSASEISSHFTFSSYPLCSGPLPCFLSTSLIGFFFLPVSTHARLSEC